MRHQNKGFKLGRTAAHRKATLSALANALIKNHRISTTVPKAKALRMYVEPIINRAKVDTMHNRREVFSHLQDKESIKELFGTIGGLIQNRPGGYTRIVRLGKRQGDAAEMAIIELVDFNDVKPGAATKKKSTRRTRRSATKKADATATEESQEESAA